MGNNQKLGRLLNIAIVFLGGCSIYPQPDDVSSFESRHISRILRCQMRTAIRDFYIDVFEAVKDRIIFRDKLSGIQAAEYFRQNKDRFDTFQWSEITSASLRKTLQGYGNVSIAWDFTIDTSEMNSAGVDLTLVKTLTRGSNTYGFLAKNDRTRDIKRQFRVFDSWDSLMRGTKANQCKVEPTEANPLYPTNGTLRFYSLVRNFAEQNQVQNLGGEKEDWTTAQMSDTLTFTTKTQGNFDPIIATNTAPLQLIPTQLKLNVDNYRQELYTIIVLFRLPLKTDKLPRFDERGLISASKAESQRAVSNRALDVTRDYNAQDNVQKLTTAVQNISAR